MMLFLFAIAAPLALNDFTLSLVHHVTHHQIDSLGIVYVYYERMLRDERVVKFT